MICAIDVKLYQLKIAVRGHVSIMLICNAVGEALPPIYCVSGTKLKHNVLQGSPAGMLHLEMRGCDACIFRHVWVHVRIRRFTYVLSNKWFIHPGHVY